jgi:hypothetical protein
VCRVCVVCVSYVCRMCVVCVSCVCRVCRVCVVYRVCADWGEPALTAEVLVCVRGPGHLFWSPPARRA